MKTVLHIYMEDPVMPLPTPEEVLLCNSSTTAEEVGVCSVKVLYNVGTTIFKPNYLSLFFG